MSTEAEPLLGAAPQRDTPQLLVHSPQPATEQPMRSLYSPSFPAYGSVPDEERSRSESAQDEEEDDTILEHGLTASLEGKAHATSNTQSLMHLLKGNVGTGILAMPAAIHHAGLWTGFVGLMIMGAIAIYCMHLLVRTSRHLSKVTGRPSLDYGGVAKKAIEHYLQNLPEAKRVRIGKATKITINTFLCITQFGFCTVYILFIAQNVSQVIEAATDGYKLNYRLYAFMVFILLVPYVFVKKLTHLAPFSLVANLLTAVGLVITVQYFFHELPPASDYPAFSSWRQLPLYFGIAIYAFEGIGVVLPIENKMRHPEDFAVWNGVLNTGMILVVIMYITVGFYGYMKFGSDVLGSITLNLPSTWLYLSARLMFSIAIYITYGLQFYVPILVMWTGIRRKLTNIWLIENGEIILRLIFLAVTFLLSISIPHLDLMISLIGAISCSTLAFIFPPVIDILAFSPDGQLRWYNLLFDILVITVGTLSFFVGSIVTIMQIIQQT